MECIHPLQIWQFISTNVKSPDKELTKSEKIHMNITFSIFHRNNDFLNTGINFSRYFNPTRIEWDGAIIETHDLKLKLENNYNIKMVDILQQLVHITQKHCTNGWGIPYSCLPFIPINKIRIACNRNTAICLNFIWCNLMYCTSAPKKLYLSFAQYTFKLNFHYMLD